MRTDALIIVKAKITMKKTEEGGRQFGFKSGYSSQLDIQSSINKSPLVSLRRCTADYCRQVILLFYIPIDRQAGNPAPYKWPQVY